MKVPYDWGDVLDYYDPEFMEINGHSVLLPVGKENHPNITLVRCIVSKNGHSLTLFLKDTTLIDDPACEFFQAGFVAICDKLPGQDFFVAILYHEWFMIDNEALLPL